MRNFLNLSIACATLFTATLAAETTTNHSVWVLDHIRPYPDFPKPGISFKWYGPLLRNPDAFKKAIDEFADRYCECEIDAIAGLDARGFIFGAALAYELGLPFVPVRKSGKLPGDVVKTSYSLEYGDNSIEIEKNALKKGDRVLVIDDLIATGGTAAAACALVEKLDAQVVEVACLIELGFLKGHENIPAPVFSLITID